MQYPRAMGISLVPTGPACGGVIPTSSQSGNRAGLSTQGGLFAHHRSRWKRHSAVAASFDDKDLRVAVAHEATGQAQIWY
jgi:hypothetical protein